MLANESGDGLCREYGVRPLRGVGHLDAKQHAESPQGFRGWKSRKLLERLAAQATFCVCVCLWQGSDETAFDFARKGGRLQRFQ